MGLFSVSLSWGICANLFIYKDDRTKDVPIGPFELYVGWQQCEGGSGVFESSWHPEIRARARTRAHTEKDNSNSEFNTIQFKNERERNNSLLKTGIWPSDGHNYHHDSVRLHETGSDSQKPSWASLSKHYKIRTNHFQTAAVNDTNMSDTDVQLTPCCVDLEAGFHTGPTHRSTFCSVSVSSLIRFFPKKKIRTHFIRLEEKKEQTLPTPDSPTVLFSSQISWTPACLRVFLCPRFFHGELRRGCSVRAVNHAPCAVKFGSADGTHAEMSIKARKAEIFRLDALPGLALSSSRSVSDISGFHSALSSVTVEPLCRHLMDTMGTAVPNRYASSLLIFFWHIWN